MTAFPAQAARFFREFSERRLHPVCLRADRDFRLRRVWGDPGHYGFEPMAAGDDCRSPMPFLWGLDADSELELPFVGAPNELAMHVHIKPLDGGLMVLLVDATAERDRQQDVQQIANQVRLLNHRQQRLVEELQRARDELILRREEAEEANRLKSRFISGMSHEFRTPIASILGNAQRLEDRLPPTGQDSLKAITRGARYLLSLVDNLLDQGRLDADQWVLSPAPTRVGELLEDLRMVFADPAARKGLALTLVTDGLPDQVRLDATRLRQILVNLLANALKFTLDGSVHLRLDWAGGQLSARVIDTGPGIPKPNRKRLFLPFSRVGDTALPGAGLGLAISRGLARRMGGSLEIADRAPPGCEFILRLPAPRVRHQPPPPQRDAYVVVAEDDPDIAELIELLLSGAGYRVRCAQTGVQALEIIAAGRPDLMVTDLNLPGLDGLQLLASLRERSPELPVVVMTASARKEDQRRAIGAGATRYLVKPVEPDTLLTVLGEVLEAGNVC